MTISKIYGTALKCFLVMELPKEAKIYLGPATWLGGIIYDLPNH